MTRISVRRRRRRLTDNVGRKTSFRHGREQERWMLPAAVGGGAILMYFFDASTGSRRRARLRDWLMSSLNRSQEAVGTTWRDARNRGRGLFEELRTLLISRRVSDDILIERVRAILGTLVRHPRSIEVMANDGRIVLGGPVLSAEINGLLDGVRKVGGVREVENRLEVHEQANDIPGLQGNPIHVTGGSQFELMQDNWSPTARMTVGVGGAMLAAYGALRRDRMGAALAIVGGAALTRASLNVPWKRITGMGAGHRAVEMSNTMRIEAALPHVFAFWTRYADFPKYTTHVKEVLEQGDGRSRWTVVRPSGITLSWNAVMTRFIPNEELAWRTEADSSVQHTGRLKFKDNGDGSTTVYIRINYNPPAGMIGHGAARMLGVDLHSLLEDDLLRIKTVLEEAMIPRDVQRGESNPTLKAEQLET